MKGENEIVERLERIESLLIERREKPLTLEEAADYLDLSNSYLYKLTSAGKIPHFKPAGKKLYFRRSDLNEYLFQNRVKSQEEIDREAARRVMDAPATGDPEQSAQ